MNDDEYWYNLKEENGSVVIDKSLKSNTSKMHYYDSSSNYNYDDKKEKKKIEPIYLALGVILFLPFVVLIISLLIAQNNPSNNPNKYRTIMLYMVGSDLESTGGVASFDLKDIVGNNIDLDNINVLIMAGGSKVWHNFVKNDELGIYEITKAGYKKVKKFDLSNMGSSDTLSLFVNYVHDNYHSSKYDMIFWNHGLGAVGLEDDELYDDYLDISELKLAFEDSPFMNEKLELVVFNNCMAGNIHFASIMKNFAEYMVASEEVMYVGSNLDRLNFINNIKKEDSGYEIGLSYIRKSDESMSNLDKMKYGDLDTTLSIIDLSKIDSVEKNLNAFFNSIDLNNNNYKTISRIRRKTNTYGGDDYSYDMVDLYSLAESLDSYSSYNAKEKLKESINEAILYNSASNEYSKGISIYFPYYGSGENITSNLYNIDKVWNNDYTNFINKFYSLSNSARRANRAGEDDKVLLLTNDIIYDNNSLSIDLTSSEQEKYQNANIYIFSKNNDKFDLLLKSDEVEFDNNKLIFNKNKVLKTDNNIIISSIYEKGLYKVYGSFDNSDVIVKVTNDNGYGSINGIFVDSKDKPIGGLVDYNDELINFYSTNYSIDNELTNDWYSKIEKKPINNLNNGINVVQKDLANTYVLIEMFDENNDVFYSKLTEIK